MHNVNLIAATVQATVPPAASAVDGSIGFNDKETGGARASSILGSHFPATAVAVPAWPSISLATRSPGNGVSRSV